MKKLFLSLFLPIVSYAIDIKFNGEVSAFSKIGFDTQKYDPSKNIYPTDSYASLSAKLDFSSYLKYGFSLGLGGMINGIVYDSGIYQSNTPQALNYIGYYAGHSGQNLQSPRYYMIHNAYIKYDYQDMLQIILGRYETQGYDWFSGYNQGAEIKFKYQNFKLWGMFSDSRASAYNDWFWDYGRYYTEGKALFIGGVNYTQFGISFSPYIHYIPDSLLAPGFNLSYEYQGDNFSSQTTLVGLFPFYFNSNLRDTTLFSQPLNKSAQSLFIRQRFEIQDYFFGAIIYKNFGNANGRIGIYGDPIGYDIWTASVYDTGPSLSDMVGADALSGFVFVGSKFQNFKWQLLGRITHSPRSDEQSLALYMDYKLLSNVNLGGKIEYFRDVTHQGYSIGNAEPLEVNNTSDRSHMMLHITYYFE